MDDQLRQASAMRAEALALLRAHRAAIDSAAIDSAAIDGAPIKGAAGPGEPHDGGALEHWVQRWTIRDLLLALGVFSLIAAIVSFAVVTWGDLSTAGRVGLVISVTMIVGSFAYLMDRRGMTATAEAITTLWAALLVADIAAGRFLLFDDSPAMLVWGGGLALVAALLLVFAHVTHTRSAPLLGLIAASLPLPLIALNEGSQILAAAAGLVGFIGVRVLAQLLASPTANFERKMTNILQTLSWCFAALAVVLGLSWNGSAGIAMLLVSGLFLVGGAVWFSSSEQPVLANLWTALSTILVVAAPTVLAARWTDGAWPVLTAAVAAAFVLAVARRAGELSGKAIGEDPNPAEFQEFQRGLRPTRSTPSHPGRLGALAVAGLVLVMISGLMAVMVVWAVGRIFEPTLHPWSGRASDRLIIEDLRESEDQFTALATFSTLMLTAFDLVRAQRHLWWGVLGGFAVAGVVLMIAIFGAPAWLATAAFVALGVLAMSLPAGRTHLEVDAAAIAFTGLGVAISITTPELTIGALATVAITHAALSYRTGVGTIRSGWLLVSGFAAATGLVFAVATNEGLGQGAVGLAVLISAGVLTLALPVVTFWTQPEPSGFVRYLQHLNTQLLLEASAAVTTVGAMIGIGVRGSSGEFTAGLLVAAGFCTLHATRPMRHWLVVVASALAAGAAAVQLQAADVTTVEAYAAPAAAAAAVFGYYVYRGDNSVSSWVSQGLAIAVAIGPSMVVSLGRDGGVRPLLLPVAGAILIGIGLMGRFQAPVVLGAGVIAAVATDLLITFASELPRWIPFGLVGLLLVFLGADFDRNRERAHGLLLLIKDLR